MNRKEIKCEYCGEEFVSKSCKGKKYCSWQCYTLARTGKPRYRVDVPVKKVLKSRFCEFCGVEFVPSSNSRRFCGRSCCSKHTMVGRKLSPEWKKAISAGNIGRENHNFYSRGNSGFRPDLNKFFRSNWEANVARIFNYCNIAWKYEEKDSRVFLSTCSYLPDFFLPELGMHVEVKGYNRDNKLKMLHQEKPDFPIKIIDCEVYTKLSMDFRSKIENWEQ